MNRSGCCLRHLSQKYKCQLGPSSNVIWNHQSSCVPFIPFILSKTSYFKSPFLLLIPILLAQWPGRNHWFHSSHCHGRPGSFWSLQYLWPIYDTVRFFLNLFDSEIRGQICKLFQPPNAVDDLNQVIEEVLESIGFISCSREFWKMVLKFDEICGDPNIIHHFYSKSDVCVVSKEVPQISRWIIMMSIEKVPSYGGPNIILQVGHHILMKLALHPHSCRWNSMKSSIEPKKNPAQRKGSSESLYYVDIVDISGSH